MYYQTLILAADGGGTKCDMLVVDAASGQPLRNLERRREDFPSELLGMDFSGGIGRSDEVFNLVSSEILQDLEYDQIYLLCNVGQWMRQGAGLHLLDDPRTVGRFFVSEPYAVLLAENCQFGMTLVSGTGMVGCVVEPDKPLFVIDGAGPVGGDWGGAYWIGQTFMRRAMREQSFSDVITPDMAAIYKAFEIKASPELVYDGSREVVNAMYWDMIMRITRHTDRSEIASLSKICAERAAQGSVLANQVLHDAGREIATSALLAADKFALKERSDYPVICSGSVLVHDKVIYAGLLAELRNSWPKAQIRMAVRTQVCGRVAYFYRQIFDDGGNSAAREENLSRFFAEIDKKSQE